MRPSSTAGAVSWRADSCTDASLDLAALRAQCSLATLSAEQCYQAFRAIGIDYGPAHQTIETLHVGSGQVLAKLVFPPIWRIAAWSCIPACWTGPCRPLSA